MKKSQHKPRGAVIQEFLDVTGLKKIHLYGPENIDAKTFQKAIVGSEVQLYTIERIARSMSKHIRSIGADTPKVRAFLSKFGLPPVVTAGDLLASRPQSDGDLLSEERIAHMRAPWRNITWWDPTDYRRLARLRNDGRTQDEVEQEDGQPKENVGALQVYPFDRPNRRLVYWQTLNNGGAIWFEQNLVRIDPDGTPVWHTMAHSWFQVPLLHFFGKIGHRGWVFRRLDTYDDTPSGVHLDHIYEFFFCEDARHYVDGESWRTVSRYAGQDHVFLRRVPVSDTVPIDYAGALHLHGPNFEISDGFITSIGTDDAPDPDMGMFARE